MFTSKPAGFSSRNGGKTVFGVPRKRESVVAGSKEAAFRRNYPRSRWPLKDQVKPRETLRLAYLTLLRAIVSQVSSEKYARIPVNLCELPTP